MTDEDYKKYQVERFQKYVKAHKKLVDRLGKETFGVSYPNHDNDKLVGNSNDDYIIAYSKRNLQIDGERKLDKEEKDEVNNIVGIHVKLNSHHPEYWDSSIKETDFDNDNPPHVDASKMPERALKEMCCDWCAVAIKKNQPFFRWYNNNVGENKRYFFSDEQRTIIEDYLSKIEKVSKEKNIKYEE